MLAARAWALRVLAGGSVGSPPDLPAGELRALLSRERCALPLASRLGAAVPAAVQNQALRDAQVALVREAPLGDLARFSRDHGVPVVALKSAAHTTRMPSLDLDVLVPEEHLAAVVEYLDARGYRSTRGYLELRDLHHVHLPARGRLGEMMVEVHFALGDGLPVDQRIWLALRAHPSHPGMSRLPADREAWHLLWHSVVVHPHRRGQLGDLLLIAEALGDLDEAGRAWLRARVRAHPAAEPLGRALRMAEGLRGGAVPVDEFRAVAAAHYRWRTTRALALLPDRPAKQLETLWFELVEGERLGPLWDRLVLTDGAPSARPWLFAVERAAPGLTRAGRVATRAAVFALTLPIAAGLTRLSLADARRPAPDA